MRETFTVLFSATAEQTICISLVCIYLSKYDNLKSCFNFVFYIWMCICIKSLPFIYWQGNERRKMNTKLYLLIHSLQIKIWNCQVSLFGCLSMPFCLFDYNRHWCRLYSPSKIWPLVKKTCTSAYFYKEYLLQK